MKIGIMQPYFLPYIGYFQLMNLVDNWVVFDNIQYIRHGWVNRNRILSPNLEKEWQYINVPIKKFSQKSLINQIEINYNVNWIDQILGRLTYYKKINAPYYDTIKSLLEPIINKKFKKIHNLNLELIKVISLYLNLDTKFYICSKMNFDFHNDMDPGDWALEIANQMGASKYINPIGGKELFNLDKFQNKKIKIEFLQSEIIKYKQSKRIFVKELSIIDLLMFCSIKEIKYMLDQFVLVK